jgi:hypothetical protein
VDKSQTTPAATFFPCQQPPHRRLCCRCRAPAPAGGAAAARPLLVINDLIICQVQRLGRQPPRRLLLWVALLLLHFLEAQGLSGAALACSGIGVVLGWRVVEA